MSSVLSYVALLGMIIIGAFSGIKTYRWEIHKFPNMDHGFPTFLVVIASIVSYLLIINFIFDWIPAAYNDAKKAGQRHQLFAPIVALVALAITVYGTFFK